MNDDMRAALETLNKNLNQRFPTSQPDLEEITEKISVAKAFSQKFDATATRPGGNEVANELMEILESGNFISAPLESISETREDMVASPENNSSYCLGNTVDIVKAKEIRLALNINGSFSKWEIERLAAELLASAECNFAYMGSVNGVTINEESRFWKEYALLRYK